MTGTATTFDQTYLKPSTIAKRLDVDRGLVHGMIKDGTLPHIKIGTAVRVPALALEAYLRRQEQAQAVPYVEAAAP